MTPFSSAHFPTLFCDRWTTKGLARSIESIDADDLCREFNALTEAAPRRSEAGKLYFEDHQGLLPAENYEVVSEMHLAIALWRLKSLPARPGVSRLRLLDYQFPLKAYQSDTGVGKVDLLGATDRRRLAVVELKVPTRNRPRTDAPIHALMEGLRYAAIVRANQGAIAHEARDRFAIDLSDQPPIVQILAPGDWWRDWCDDMPQRTRRVAGAWESAFVELSTRLEERLGITVECASLPDVSLADVKFDAHRPYLTRPPTLNPVNLNFEPSVEYSGYGDFEKHLRERFWAWADRHHTNELDGGRRDGRPPVLRREFASKGCSYRPTRPRRAELFRPFHFVNVTVGSAASRVPRHSPRAFSVRLSSSIA